VFVFLTGVGTHTVSLCFTFEKMFELKIKEFKDSLEMQGIPKHDLLTIDHIRM
jgi:hypothetical protein